MKKCVILNLDKSGISEESDKHVELIVAGNGWHARQLIKETCLVCHFPNYENCADLERRQKLKTKIVIVDTFINSGEDDLLVYDKRFFCGFGNLSTIVKRTYYSSFDNKKKNNSCLVKDILAEQFADSNFSFYNFVDIEFEFVNCEDQSLYFDVCKKIAILSEKNNAIVTIVKAEDALYHTIDNRNYRTSLVAEAGALYQQNKSNSVPWQFVDEKKFEEYLLRLVGWEYRFRSMGLWYKSKKKNNLYTRVPNSENVRKQLEHVDSVYDRVEHNRWVVESALSGMCPLTKEDLKDFIGVDPKKQNKDFEKRKKYFISQGRHLDICSFEDLKVRDPESIIKDKEHNMMIVRALEKIAKIQYNHLPNTGIIGDDNVNPDVQPFYKADKNHIKLDKITIILSVVLSLILFLFTYLKGTWPFAFSFSDNIEASCLDDILFFMCWILGSIGLSIMITTIIRYYHKSPLLHGSLANISLRTTIWFIGLIVSIPCIVGMILTVIGLNPSELINKTNWDENAAKPINVFWGTFYHFIDPGNQHMSSTYGGRTSAFILGTLGVVFVGGLFVPLLISYLTRFREQWKEGQIIYKFRKNKYVAIFGDSPIVVSAISQIVKKFGSENLDYIVIMTNNNVEEFRKFLLTKLSHNDMAKIVIYKGDRTSFVDVCKVKPNNTNLLSVYIVGEKDKDNGEVEYSKDSKNLKCLELILQMRKHQKMKNIFPSKLPCYVLFNHQATYTTFVQSKMSGDMNRWIQFIPFNFYETWAQRILNIDSYSSDKNEFIPIDQVRENGKVYGIDEDSDKHVHIFIIGMTRMGEALAKEVALNCHYPNFAKAEMNQEKQIIEQIKIDRVDKPRTRITFISENVYKQFMQFQNRSRALFDLSRWRIMDKDISDNVKWIDKISQFASLSEPPYPLNSYPYNHLCERRFIDPNFLDVEWEFINGKIEEDSIVGYIRNCVSNNKAITTIAVCLETDEKCLSSAIYLPHDIIDKSHQILVWQRNGKEIVDQLQGKYLYSSKSVFDGKIKGFGMVEDGFVHSQLDATIAKIIHYSKSDENLDIPLERMDWKNKCELERWSSIYSAHSWVTKFRSLSLSLMYSTKEQVEEKLSDDNTRRIYGRVEHNRWMMERLLFIGERPLTDAEWCNFKKLEGVSYLVKEWNEESVEEFFPWKYCVDGSEIDPLSCTKNEPVSREFSKLKKEYKNKGSHLDICSYWMLRQRDWPSLNYDINRFDRFREKYELIKNSVGN